MKARRFVVLAVVLVTATTAAAAQAYRNPTNGSAVALQIPGMHRAQVKRDIVYRRPGGLPLRLDVYRPRRARLSRRLPAVLVGGPTRFGRRSGQKVGWAQLISASGLAAVAFDTRSDGAIQTPRAPASDVAAAIAYVRRHARTLGLDPQRLCTLGFSIGTAPWHLWATMREPAPYVRCNVTYYGPLNLGKLSDFTLPPAVVEEYSAITYLRRDGARVAPMLVAKAGREDNAGINDSIDEFAAEAQQRGADVTFLTHATGIHGFDVFTKDARSRTIMRETLAFFRARLSSVAPATGETSALPQGAAKLRPLVLRERCVTTAERRRVLRFKAVDGVRLIGVEFGRGQRVVVLAHQGGAPPNLCGWVPYARTLAAAGYRVLVFDHRKFGSSGRASHWRRADRVDLDVLGAIRTLRARGARSIVLGGASLGGAAVLAAAPQATPAVDGVISFSSPRNYVNVSALAGVQASNVPVLFLAEEDDDPFDDDARALFEASPAREKQLEIYPGAEHGFRLLRNPSARSLVGAFLASHSAR